MSDKLVGPASFRTTKKKKKLPVARYVSMLVAYFCLLPHCRDQFKSQTFPQPNPYRQKRKRDALE